MPFDGRIDWARALFATQKVGYEGVWMLELANTGDAGRRAAQGRSEPARASATSWSADSRSEDDRADLHPDIAAHDGQPVTIKGWLHNRRSSGKIHFLIVRDGTGSSRRVMSKAAVGDETFKKADHLGQEIAGRRAAARCGPTRARRAATSWTSAAFEVVPRGGRLSRSRRRNTASTSCWTAGTCGSASPRQAAILRVRHEVINAVRDFFNGRGFILADTPIFTPAACEGTTTLFPVQYFEDTTAYLTQSGQLYNEANAMALGRVYCFGPTFRAEKSKTRRHLTEFWMVEPEMAYADLDDVMELAEELVSRASSRACSTSGARNCRCSSATRRSSRR